MFGLGRWYLLTLQLRFILVHWITRYLAAWLVAIAVAWQCTANAWDVFYSSDRPDGNNGHTAIDFGGQWIMGRMLVTGQGRFLYERNHVRNELRAGFPRADEAPGQKTRDADGIMNSFMGSDNDAAPPAFASCLLPLAVGDGLGAALLAVVGKEHCWQPSTMARAAAPSVSGPLYPPINAFVYSPLGLLSPQDGYRLMQVALLAFALLAGWGVRRLARGRIWLPVATALIIAYPGFSGAQALGQNSAITLAILVWGWVLLAEGRPGWAGVVWGLLAFKPVWALAFFIVPVLTRRWKMALAMAATGLAQIALTLPWVGVDTWWNWLEVGRAGAACYNVDENWVFLSRDLLGIPRRFMLDFQESYYQRDRLEAALVGWVMVLVVLEITTRLVSLRRDQVRAVTGPAPAFLLLGAWLCCFHFMYYDVLLSALPVFLLFTEPRRYYEPAFLAWEPLVLWHPPELTPWRTVNNNGRSPPRRIRAGVASLLALPGANYGWMRNPFTLLALTALVLNEQVFEAQNWLPTRGFPWNTACVATLWGWCAWLLTRQRFDAPKAEQAYGHLPITALDVER
jgi:arabinofuranan 3-O-arabinosyltransferase